MPKFQVYPIESVPAVVEIGDFKMLPRKAMLGFLRGTTQLSHEVVYLDDVKRWLEWTTLPVAEFIDLTKAQIIFVPDGDETESEAEESSNARESITTASGGM